MPADAIARDLEALTDAKSVVRPPESQRFDKGYRYGSGTSLCVVQPATLDAVRAVARYCARQSVRLVAQGANTGLVGASTPDATGDQIVLSMARFCRVEALDPVERVATVQSGTTLSMLNVAAADHDLFFPIDLGADPSLGGMIATNTGGARLLRYGDVQRNLMGLEVVLLDEDATVLSDMRGLRKDNSGIDWKQLFVGTSGTFGLITRAKVELHRKPRQSLTALLLPRDVAVIPELVDRLESSIGELMLACEGMSGNAIAAAIEHHPSLRSPFPTLPDYAVLLELGTSLPASLGLDLETILAHVLETFLDGPAPLLADILIGRGDEIWALRHAISDGLKRSGHLIAFDIAMPRSQFPHFRTEALALLKAQFPFLRLCDFGHCGDGGAHFNFVGPREAPDGIDYAVVTASLQTQLYDLVERAHGGTFSAEHGVGPYNAHIYRRYAAPAERELARKLKGVLDPKGLIGNVDFS